MPETSTHLLLPYLLAAQAQKHVTVNEALRLLDGLVQLADLGALLGPGDTLSIRIFQLSALVGRGAPASVTLEF